MRIAKIIEELKGKALVDDDFMVVITPHGIKARCKAKDVDKTFWAIAYLYAFKKLRE